LPIKKISKTLVGGNSMKTGKKMLENRVDEFCRNSLELLQNIHSRCGAVGETGSGQPKKGRKKRAKKK
jgi:hypothetical protein